MSKSKDGGPAFPKEAYIAGPDGKGDSLVVYETEGMSKREFYAAAALQGWLARYTPDKGIPDIGHTADFCFRVADAMVKRSEQE